MKNCYNLAELFKEEEFEIAEKNNPVPLIYAFFPTMNLQSTQYSSTGHDITLVEYKVRIEVT